MDAICLRRQPDPVGPDRVIRPGLDGERLFGFDAFELVIGIVAVVRVGIGGDDLESTAWSWLFLAADGRRKKAYQRAGWIERLHRLTRLVDFDPADRQFRRLVEHVGNENGFARPVELLAGIEPRKQDFAYMKLLADGFALARLTD